ncbi:hypothetical protein SteCoe_18626 [Stentor coeruleus]|uniref:Uncharacterized protein n=1 Tax=Stentor coeruleus TaxID=5963 RepID=A0A1R2BWD4_9CILI|nr:hypothetical protein SteCoe_18626 [Stentor coeruleus]
MLNRSDSGEELDITVTSSVFELEKTLLQVRSLRYQMYSKYLSEKLSYEKTLRKLEQEIYSSTIESKENIPSSHKGQKSLRKPFGDLSLNIINSSLNTTSDKSIQTTNSHIPNILTNSITSKRASHNTESSLQSSGNFSKFLDSYRDRNSFDSTRDEVTQMYDERLFKIVEQLEHIACSNNYL